MAQSPNKEISTKSLAMWLICQTTDVGGIVLNMVGCATYLTGF